GAHPRVASAPPAATRATSRYDDVALRHHSCFEQAAGGPMRRIALAFTLAAGCTTQIGAPTPVFDDSALSTYNLDDRAFVEGHALGVLYLSLRVPDHTQGTGFTYAVGLSAPSAKVAYDWNRVIANASTTSTTAAGSSGCNEGLGGTGCGSGSGSGSGTGSGSG